MPPPYFNPAYEVTSPVDLLLRIVPEDPCRGCRGTCDANASTFDALDFRVLTRLPSGFQSPS